MKLRTLLAASAVAFSAIAFSGGSFAQSDASAGDAPNVQDQVEPRERAHRDWQGERRGEGERGPRQDFRPPAPPPGDNFQGLPQPTPPIAGNFPPPGQPPAPPPGANLQPPPPPPPGGVQPPPPPGDPRQYGGGWERPRDRDRDRRRDRARDGAAVVLGLGVLGALASRPHYQDPYYSPYPPPPPPPPPPQGYGPGYYDGYPRDRYPQPNPYGDYGPQPGSGLINCSSKDYRTQWCPIPYGARASLYRKRSSSSCTFGRDWGLGRGAIWVANGCRADFVIY